MLFSIFVVIILFLVTMCVYHRFKRSGRLRAKIPGPIVWPIIGNSLNLTIPRDKLFTYVRTWNKTYGDIVVFCALDITSVSIYNPDDIETVLSSTRFNEKRQPYTFLRDWLGEGLLVSNGSKWLQRRKILTPTFHFNILKKFARTFEEETEIFLKQIESEVGKSETDIMHLINKITLRNLCKTAMGTSMSEDLESITHNYWNAIHNLGNGIVQRTGKVWLFIDFSYKFSKLARTEKAIVKDLHEFTRNVIRERKAYLQENPEILSGDGEEMTNSKGRLAMLDLLIQSNIEGKIDDEGIREEVDTFMFRGHDTTAMVLLFLIMRLANEPEAQEKIYEEMQRIFGNSDRSATMDDVKDMKYLECCIKESMRLYPSVPFVARYANEEVQLGGYTVPKGSIIQIHIYDIHRRPDIYPDPERFMPERFLPENSINRHPYAYIPFSAGPRNCIGQKFAMLEMKILMSSLIRRYRLEPVTRHTDVKFIADLVLRPNHPIYVRFNLRK